MRKPWVHQRKLTNYIQDSDDFNYHKFLIRSYGGYKKVKTPFKLQKEETKHMLTQNSVFSKNILLKQSISKDIFSPEKILTKGSFCHETYTTRNARQCCADWSDTRRNLGSLGMNEVSEMGNLWAAIKGIFLNFFKSIVSK